VRQPGLLLEAVDADGPLRWRWRLTDEETGKPLAEHAVNIDPASRELAIFRDLDSYIYSYAAPDRRVDDGARFVHQAGEWAGRELLGPAVGAAILAEAPVTVRVTVPDTLGPVLLWPLELAHADGKPLAAQGDVTLVYDVGPAVSARRKDDVAGALRMLAVFSQPTATSVLALRRERYALTRLIAAIAARERALIQLRVVQYGVTRQRLAKIADSGDGWDVLHLSGHGTGGVFTLETRDGTPDYVSTADLVDLLRPARRRLKLAVVSACESAADTTAKTLRLLGLTEQAQALEAAEAGRGRQGAPGLAQTLVRELDCAVIGMRYPVADEFAIAFTDVFYEHLLGRRQPADVAVARAVADAARPAPSAAIPAASIATPGVFGARAAGLVLRAPHGNPVINPAGQPMAYFPAEPPRFVGRAAAMAQASAALAPGSGRTAVMLHGMAGAGKTACALELAYRHAGGFAAAAWWQAPTRAEEWPTALADLANRLDIQLAGDGFTIAGHIGTVTALDSFLPRLRAAMANSGVLLVLDNLETLLTPDGTWRDDRLAKLITALTDHDGESRVILTSRVLPANLTSGPLSARAVTLPVHALSLDESVALARELPNLRALLHADAGPVRTDQAAPAERVRSEQADRDRVRRVLRVVQGHPKLMELADAAAVNRDRLDAQLVAAEHAVTAEGSVPGRSLDAFFRDGTSTLHPAQFLDTLTAWTVTALGVLSPEARLMAEFVACLEDNDRLSYVIEATWTNLCRRLGRPVQEPGPEPALGKSPASARAAPDAAGAVPASEPPLAPAPLLAALTAAALIEAEPLTSPGAAAGAAVGEQPSEGAATVTEDRPVPGGGPVQVAYRVHPGVAAAITAQAGQSVREATDAELAAFWDAVSDQAREREGGEDSGLVVRAGLAAAPYLLRRGDWDTAGSLLEQALLRDRSPGTVQAVLPSMRRIAAAMGGPENAVMLARALAGVDAGEAERLLRGAADAAAGSRDFWVASTAAGDLVNLLAGAGRLAEALEVASQQAEFTGRAGLGPWTRLADQAQRLQVLGWMGDHARVLAETETLRASMAALPARRGASETVHPWNVREAILGTGYESALATGDWQRCLDLNAEIAASKRQRGASLHEVTRTRFNDAGPLIRLGQLDEAGRLLAECQRVFEDHADPAALATVLTTRADLEAVLGRWQAAADLARAALRLSYARPEPQGIAIGHYNLANSLGELGGDRAGQRAHRLATALICQLSGMAHDLAGTVHLLAEELRGDDPAAPSSATVAQVVATAELTEGVRLGALLAALQPDPQAVEDALAEILRAAAESPLQAGEPDTAALLRDWEPMIAAIAAACQAGPQPPAELSEFLDEGAKLPDWSALVAVFRRILAGERDQSALLTGLDPVDTAIARETLARLEQPA
jgi:tetratricopeptide (TPR) repeat protein